MIDNSEQDHQEAASGPGSLLRARREQQGLTPEEAAAGLNLRPGIIEALEADRYDLLPPTTFVRGYLRAYAKLLGMKEHAVMAAFERQQPEARSERLRPAVASSASRRRRGSGLRWLVLLIAVLLIGYVGYRSYFSTSPERPVEAQQAQPTGSPTEPGAGGTPAASSLAEEVLSEPAAQPPDLEAAELSSAFEQAASSDAPAEVQEALPPVAQAAPLEPAPAAVAPEPAPARTLLSIEINEESWVEVYAANNQRLHAALVQGPRTLELSGQPPLRVVIGNAQNARLFYAGQQIPLAPYTRREVARLTVPLP